MNEDIVCLLQDLGKEVSADVIANFIIRNPEIEDLIATKMGNLLSTDSASTSSPSNPSNAASNPEMSTHQSSSIADKMSLAFGRLTNGFHKMIFIVNMDLNMGRGKQCAQVAHAALGLYLKIQQSNNNEDQFKIYQWLSMGQKKIVVKGDDLQHLEKIQAEAEKVKLPTLLVADAGCTQIAPGSKTVLGIFGTDEELSFTRSLKLL